MSWMVLKFTCDYLPDLDLVDNINYALVEWAPQVAPRRRGALGGFGDYHDVVETITLDIFGEKAADVFDAFTLLSDYMDAADRWGRGVSKHPVILHVKLQNSNATEPFQCMVVDRADDDALISLPTTFNDALMVYEMGPVEIKFKRRGTWLGVEYSGTAAYANNPTIRTVTLNKSRVPSPTKLSFVGLTASAELIDDSYILMTGVPVNSTYGSNFVIIDASGLTSTEFSSVDDSSNNALGDDIMRIDASSDTEGTLSTGTIQTEVETVTIFAAVRNNSSTTAWKIRAKSEGFGTVTSSWVWIDTSVQTPRIIPVGRLTNSSGTHLSFKLEVETSDSSGTLDINYMVVFPDGDDSAYIGIDGDSYSSDGRQRDLIIDHRVMTSRTPLATIQTMVEDVT